MLIEHARLTFIRLLILVALLSVGTARAEDWPGWRGPRGDGSSLETGLPAKWGPGENIAWKTELPGIGHASPVVWKDRVYTVTCLPDTSQRVLLAIDRRSGEILWQRAVVQSPLEHKHELNSHASSTPAVDDQRIYVTFLDRNQMLVAAFDHDGHSLWLVRPGEFASMHGYCSCPVLFEDSVIVNGDHDGDAYVVALNKATGSTVWKIDRENKTRSYSTPLIRAIGGRPQLMLSGSKSVASYDPRSGSEIWRIKGPTEQFVASMVYGSDLLFMTCGFPDHHMLAIRPDGNGDVTRTHVAWRTNENCSYVPSPVAVGDYFLVVSDEGIASCFGAGSGERQWRKRIGPRYSASLVTAEGLAYFLDDDGTMTVVRPGPDFDAVAINKLGEACYASPAISQGQILIRGERHLFAIGPAR